MMAIYRKFARNSVDLKHLLLCFFISIFTVHIFLSIYIKRNYNTCNTAQNNSALLGILINLYGDEYICYNDDQRLISDKIYNNSLNIRDVLIVIKTTESHSDRINYIISTWYQLARKQVNKIVYLF